MVGTNDGGILRTFPILHNCINVHSSNSIVSTKNHPDFDWLLVRSLLAVLPDALAAGAAVRYPSASSL